MPRSVTAAILTCGVVLAVAWSCPVYGQLHGYSSRNMARPALSPYLDYFRTDTGLLPRYQQFVRPKQRLLSETNRNRQAVNWLQSSAQETARRFEAEQVRSTGRGGSYMNYLHFYPRYSRGR